MILGLAPFETYYDRLVDAVGKTGQRAGLGLLSQTLQPREGHVHQNQGDGHRRFFGRLGWSVRFTYSDCSMGRGLIGTDC